MEIERQTIVKEEISFLRATMGVRYWQDCDYSKDGGKIWIDPCVDDTDEESEGMREITPCVVEKRDYRGDPEYYWEITIDLENGKILDWPEGFCLRTHYKVCDDGEYVFLDSDMKPVVNITKEYDQYYVPNFLAIEDSGYGDYVYINIDGEGNIEHFDEMKGEIEDYFKEI